MYISAEGKIWYVEAEREARKAWKRKKPIEVPCEIWITVYTSTRRDADGSIKPVMDVLQKAEVIANDYLFYAVHAIRESCKKGEDRVEVQIMGY